MSSRYYLIIVSLLAVLLPQIVLAGGNAPEGGGGSCGGQLESDGTQGQQQAYDDGLYTCTGTAWVPEAFIVGGVDQTNSAPSCSSTTAGMIEWTGSAFQGCNGSTWGSLGSSSSSYVPTTPGGRLTLESHAPVMINAQDSAISTIYYADYVNDYVPVYNGTAWTNQAIGGQISLALDSTTSDTGSQQSGNIYDLFAGLNSGTLVLCTGPAWAGTNFRGVGGAGSADISLLNGIWTNAISTTCRYGSATGNTITCGVNQCTYLGSMYATANGQTSALFNDSGAGGGANIVGLYNAYNRVRTLVIEYDNTTSWTYATTSWRAADGNTNNSIHFLDGLQQSNLRVETQNTASSGTSGDGAAIGVDVDSTLQPTVISTGEGPSGDLFTMHAEQTFPPVLGYHYAAAVEIRQTAGTATFQPTAHQYVLILDYEM